MLTCFVLAALGASVMGLTPAVPVESDEITEEMAKEIWLSPERQHFDLVRIEGLRLMDSALRAGTPKEALMKARKAALDGDAQMLESLLFSNKGEAAAFYATQVSAYDALMGRFPVLSTINTDADDGATCAASFTPEQRVDALFSVVSDDGIGLDKLIALAESSAEAAAPCGGWGAFARYTACIAGCGVLMPTTAPFLFCAWMCICRFCPEMAKELGAALGIPENWLCG